MKCPYCNTENQPEARFCRSCGQALQGAPSQPAPIPASPGPQPQAPAPVSGVICAACGATAKPGARFCPRCGHELHPAAPAMPPSPAPPSAQPQPYAQQPPAPQQPAGVPQVTQPMPSAAQAQPAGAYPPQQPAPVAPPTYMESPSAPPATPAAPGQPAQAQNRFPWWGWVLIAVALVGILIVGFFVVPKVLGPLIAPTTTPMPTETSTAIPTAAPTDTPVPTVEPTATATLQSTDTPEPPTPAPAPFDISINLSVIPEDLKVGNENITLQAKITNNGTVPVNILRYEVLGVWEPALKLKTDQFIEEDPGVRPLNPQASMDLLFQFDAEQAGTAKLKVDVKMQVLAEPPFTDVIHSDVLEVTVVNP